MRAKEPALLPMALVGLLALAAPAPISAQESQAETPPPTYQPRTEVEIRSALESLLADTLYRGLRRQQERERRSERDAREAAEEAAEAERRREDAEPGWLERLRDWLRERSRDRSQQAAEDGPLGRLALDVLAGFIYVVAAAVLMVVVALIIQSVLRRRAGALDSSLAAGPALPAQDAAPPGEQASNEYVQRAGELAAQGQYGAAIRELLRGAMSWVERQDLIRFRQGLTNGDYLRAITRQPARRDALARIVAAFEHVYFGKRRATPEQYQECLRGFREAFLTE